MPFQTRNAYYLRISATAVLPLYVYLDERHIGWMSDQILQRLLEDIRPKIISKLHAEAHAYVGVGSAPSSAKRGTVDVHRGDTYQFAYFFRHTEPHAVLIKQRDFIFAPRPPPSLTQEPKSSELSHGRKRKRSATTTPAASEDDDSSRDQHITDEIDEMGAHAASLFKAPRRSGRIMSTRRYRDSDNDSDDEPDPSRSRSSGRLRDPDSVQVEDSRTAAPLDKPIEVKQESRDGALRFSSDSDPSVQIHPRSSEQVVYDLTDEEPKPKLEVRLKYQNFAISGRCLCVVVEPWPSTRGQTPRPPDVLSHPRAEWVHASNRTADVHSINQRAKTPLFYPDDEDVPRSMTPAPSALRGMRVPPPVPLFGDSLASESDEDDEGMMQLSQMLSTTGNIARGNMEDDDEFEGAVLFADADEAREL